MGDDGAMCPHCCLRENDCGEDTCRETGFSKSAIGAVLKIVRACTARGPVGTRGIQVDDVVMSLAADYDTRDVQQALEVLAGDGEIYTYDYRHYKATVDDEGNLFAIADDECTRAQHLFD
jgi:hypothetical protein